jgi:hypothetical protein
MLDIPSGIARRKVVFRQNVQKATGFWTLGNQESGEVGLGYLYSRRLDFWDVHSSQRRHLQKLSFPAQG